MKTIGIADFEKLVMERLENPSLFENKTLVLWHQKYYTYNLPDRIIEDCCVQFNKLFPDYQAWYKHSDYTFEKDDYTEIEECCPMKDMYGFKKHGILFNLGGITLDYLIDDWLRFINTHTNSAGHLSPQWAMIACANNPKLDIDSFGDNCTLCRFQPSIDEWHDWLKPIYSADILDTIVDYMRAKGLSTDSYAWEVILEHLTEKTVDKEVGDLKQLTRRDFELALSSHHCPPSLREDLWNFIHKQD